MIRLFPADCAFLVGDPDNGIGVLSFESPGMFKSLISQQREVFGSSTVRRSSDPPFCSIARWWGAQKQFWLPNPMETERPVHRPSPVGWSAPCSAIRIQWTICPLLRIHRAPSGRSMNPVSDSPRPSACVGPMIRSSFGVPLR